MHPSPARRRGLEAAAAQGAFWPMHDLLFEHQDALRPADLVGYADQLGLDVERFKDHLREHTGAHRVAEDVEGADLSGVSGTPTFFINGRRHYGAYDLAALGRRPWGRRAGGLAASRTAERCPTARTRPRPHRNHPSGRRLQRVPLRSLSHDPSATTRPPGRTRAQAALGAWPLAVIGEVARSGLAAGEARGSRPVRSGGRSGVGAGPRFAVCNAAEGEPATFKDRLLLRTNPYRSSRAWPSPPTRSAPSVPTWA